jgi:putative spermidine/putrescine transport system permease protein
MLFGPFVAIFILAFQTPLGGLTFPMDGFSLTWFRDLIDPQQLIDFRPAIGRSLVLAATVMILTVLIAVVAALAFRRQFPGSTVVLYTLVGSLIVPSVLISIGVGLIFSRLKLPLAWWSAGIGAVLTWTLPFAVLIMFSVFRRLNPVYEEVARDLGASRLQVFRYVTLPLIAPSILGIAVMSFTLAYDEFPRTSMVSGAVNTLPLELVAFMTIRASPAIYALGTLTTIFSLLLAVTILTIVFRARRKRLGA